MAKKSKPLAVLSIMDTDKGIAIGKRMLEWMSPIYDVTVVHHDGSRFEYDGLKAMKELVMEKHKPCLYLHTRGAVNTHWTTELTHKMWEQEFGHNYQKYFDEVKSRAPRVSCPFTDESGSTWYNGFVANYAAMRDVEIEPSDDRMVYEHLFNAGKFIVRGIISNGGLDEARKYLHTTKFGEGVDIVYVVGKGSKWNNNELRFSLRSIEKFGIGVDRIIIVGYCPDWVDKSKVIHIQADDETAVKHTNIMLKIKKAIDVLHLDKPFLISSDDHFYMAPTDFSSYPHYAKGYLPDTVDNKDNPYRRSLVQTRKWLEEHGLGIFSSNPHCNTWIHPQEFTELYPSIIEADAPDGLEINCVMGNYMADKSVEFVPYKDAKVMKRMTPTDWVKKSREHHCISIADSVIDLGFCRFIHAMFPQQSKYERTGLVQSRMFSTQIARDLRMV